MPKDRMLDQIPATPPEDFSRRRFLGQSVVGAALAGALVGCATEHSKTPGNTSKAEAEYQDMPKGLTRCGLCKHFISPNACEIVGGTVQSNGWCRFYALL